MQRLGSLILSKTQPIIWIRYMDDTFAIIKRNDLDKTRKLINNTFNEMNSQQKGSTRLKFNFQTSQSREQLQENQELRYTENQVIRIKYPFATAKAQQHTKRATYKYHTSEPRLVAVPLSLRKLPCEHFSKKWITTKTSSKDNYL